MRFWDSSALIPLFVREAHSPAMESLVADDPDMMLWWASPVECGSAVHRLRREGVFTPGQAARVLAKLAGALEAALLWARGKPVGRAFVSLDERLRTAAILEGFEVLPEYG